MKALKKVMWHGKSRKKKKTIANFVALPLSLLGILLTLLNISFMAQSDLGTAIRIVVAIFTVLSFKYVFIPLAYSFGNVYKLKTVIQECLPSMEEEKNKAEDEQKAMDGTSGFAEVTEDVTVLVTEDPSLENKEDEQKAMDGTSGLAAVAEDVTVLVTEDPSLENKEDEQKAMDGTSG